MCTTCNSLHRANSKYFTSHPIPVPTPPVYNSPSSSRDMIYQSSNEIQHNLAMAVLNKSPKEQHVRTASVGLPSEEYTTLKERHNSRLLHTHLEDVYARRGLGMQGPLRRGRFDARGPDPDVPYRSPIATAIPGKRPASKHTNRVLQESKVLNATRRALGYSWHLTDHLDDGSEEYGVPRVSSDWTQWEDMIADEYLQGFNQPTYEDEGEMIQQDDSIPDRYLQEFNHFWYEDDEDNDADQLLADLTPNAPWRNHQPLRPMYGSGSEFRTSTRYRDKDEIAQWSKALCKASVTHREVVELKPTVRPEPKSFFNWGDASSPEESQNRKHSRGSSHWERLKRCFR